MTGRLHATKVSKAFGDVRALVDVSVEFHPGEIHAVLGENGAGKSTLMGVLAGFLRPDAGGVELDGVPLPSGRPAEVRRRGVHMVHQHFVLVPALTVEENIALATMGSLSGVLNVTKAAAAALAKARALGWDIPAATRVADLPVGVQQRVEIVKAIAQDARVLILDEPTAVLVPDEVDDLMNVLRGLRASGVAVILIAHKLSEVTPVCDRVTVLRQGHVVATSTMTETDAETLASWMVGGSVPAAVRLPGVPGPAALRVRDLHVKGDRGELAVNGVSFDVARGTVFGIGGVDGNGQVELAEALAQIRRPSRGTAEWLEPGAPKIGYIPQDRQADGLALSMSVEDNLKPAAFEEASCSVGGFLRPGAIRAWAQSRLAAYDVKAESVWTLARQLSGGNQQKLVVSRVMSRRPDLLIAANPTRGLDIRATAAVQGALAEAAAAGTAVVLLTTDTDELEALADQTVFLSRGRFTDRLVGATP